VCLVAALPAVKNGAQRPGGGGSLEPSFSTKLFDAALDGKVVVRKQGSHLAKLAKKGKGKEAKLAYTCNVMTDNRNGFVVEAELRQVSVTRSSAKPRKT
jgi:hypothetical protein